MNKIKKGFVSLLTASILLSGMAPANAEEADHRWCVTNGEWSEVQRDFTMARVHRIFDFDGDLHQFDPAGWEERSYDFCGSAGGGYGIVTYENRPGDGDGYWRLFSKWRS